MTLGKGLNFIPTDKISRTNIMKDFKKFERKLRLKHFFHEYKTIPKTNHPFKEKSKFSVPIIGDNPIEQYIFHTKMELSNYKPNKTKNMTKEETQCLRTLRHIETITIHKADKNNITVVQNKKDYANEGERQLNDGIHYIEIPEINIKNTMNKINEIVYNMNKDNYLDEITFKYIKYENQYITTPFAYFLPKIHKLDNEILKDIYKQQTEIKIQVPARPIISQCNGPLERIGRYLDFFLLPIVKTQTTYISDTEDFDDKFVNISKADMCVCKDIFEINSEFKGTFSKRKYQEASVPQSLLFLDSVMKFGHNIKDYSYSHSTLTIAQLLVYSTKKLSSRHMKNHEHQIVRIWKS
ncbi:unnamed protein product [Mytilus edulis]|uniref:Uncharacterized protein n=1 Tax=Mytilus edulis TaxID=6550 RepID=A0A8S3VA84_MYTED|nr:unnamed protein product [Mytilus edulis]